MKLWMHADDPMSAKPRTSLVGKSSSGLGSSSRKIQGWMASGNLQNKQLEGRGQASSQSLQRKDSLTGLDSQFVNQSGVAVVKKKRIHSQVSMFHVVVFVEIPLVDFSLTHY